MKASVVPTSRCEADCPGRIGRNAGKRRWIALSLMTLLGGCAAESSSTRPQIAPTELALEQKDETRERIRGFVDYFRDTIERTATEIEQKAQSKAARQAAVQFRVRLNAQCRAAADQADPGEVLLDLWTLSYRLVDYLTVGKGSQVFGDQQAVAQGAAREITAAIEDLARQSVAKDSFERIRQDVVTYARDNPMKEEFSGQPVKNFSDQPQGEQALRQLIAIPFAPIAALGGVSRTPESVQAVARSMDRFTDVVDDFPANARWQLQLLGTNLSETPQFTDTMASVRQLSDSSARLVDVAEAMPKNVRSEAETLLDRVDKSQPEVRATLGEAQQTAATISSASDNIRSTTTEIRSTLAEAQGASQALEKASRSVQLTAREILKFVPASMKDETGQIIGEAPAESQPAMATEMVAVAGVNTPAIGTTGQSDASQVEDTSFSFQAVTRSADALGQTTNKLQGLLAELRAFLEGKALSAEVGNLDAQWRRATDTASTSVRGIVDLIAKRTAQLLLLFFVLLIVYRVINRHLQRVKAGA
jgi:hypothetical protein